ncbi:TMAO reductase system periplasmic protein TorT [Amphritea sp. HPY]|uniref:TMAO reductase system periplasmic protein TorT n=1 Tax=Amphritea sp. HPY TaxID=3421652 RepID=UPI003D7D8140
MARGLRTAVFILLTAVTLTVSAWPVENRTPAFQFAESETIELTPLALAKKPWRLCALYPHMKDSYWLSVNFGMVQQARQLGVTLQVAEAGGYHQLERQWQQVRDCLDWQADAILLGTVSFQEINKRLKALNNSTPLFGLVNNLSAQGLSGRVGVPWYQMGYRTGSFLAKRHPAGSPPVTMAWFPGPEQRGGTPESEQGLRDALAGSSVKILTSAHGDNDRNIQRTLLQQVLDQYSDLDYLVGSAVLADVAVNELRKRSLAKPPEIISHYLSHGVYRGLKRGKILMANSDQMVLQGRLAVDQAVRSLEGLEFKPDIGPRIIQLSHENRNLEQAAESLSPAGFTPTYQVP